MDSNPDELLNLGYKQVGKKFPVFLHPETSEEYALARLEKKISKGHKGFVFDTDKSVTLEQDLLRRDITINAIAEDKDGNFQIIEVNTVPGLTETSLFPKAASYAGYTFDEVVMKVLHLSCK